MFFSRVAVARGRCLFPVLQGLPDKRVIRLGGASFNQPSWKSSLAGSGAASGLQEKACNCGKKNPSQ